MNDETPSQRRLINRVNSHLVELSENRCVQILEAINLNKYPLRDKVSRASATKLIGTLFNLGFISAFGRFLGAKEFTRLRDQFENARSKPQPQQAGAFRKLQSKVNGWAHLRYRLPRNPTLRQIAAFIAAETMEQDANGRLDKKGRWRDTWRLRQNSQVLSAYSLIIGKTPASTHCGPTARFLSKFYEMSQLQIREVEIDPAEDRASLLHRWRWNDKLEDQNWAREIDDVLKSRLDYTEILTIGTDIPRLPGRPVDLSELSDFEREMMHLLNDRHVNLVPRSEIGVHVSKAPLNLDPGEPREDFDLPKR